MPPRMEQDGHVVHRAGNFAPCALYMEHAMRRCVRGADPARRRYLCSAASPSLLACVSGVHALLARDRPCLQASGSGAGVDGVTGPDNMRSAWAVGPRLLPLLYLLYERAT